MPEVMVETVEMVEAAIHSVLVNPDKGLERAAVEVPVSSVAAIQHLSRAGLASAVKSSSSTSSQPKS